MIGSFVIVHMYGCDRQLCYVVCMGSFAYIYGMAVIGSLFILALGEIIARSYRCDLNNEIIHMHM